MSPSYLLLLAIVYGLALPGGYLALSAAATTLTGDGATCGVGLANAVYDAYVLGSPSTRKQLSQTAFQSAMCFESEAVFLGNKAWGVNSRGVLFQVSGSKAGAQKLLDAYKSSLCSLGGVLSAASLDAISPLVDPNIVSEYLQCTGLYRRGVIIESSLSSDRKTIVITMGHSQQVKGPVIYQQVAQSGPVEYCKYMSSLLRPGFALNTTNGFHSLQCGRKDAAAGPITITVLTSAGAASFELPDVMMRTGETELEARVSSLEGSIKALAALKADVDRFRKDVEALKSTKDTVARLQATLDQLTKKASASGS